MKDRLNSGSLGIGATTERTSKKNNPGSLSREQWQGKPQH